MNRHVLCFAAASPFFVLAACSSDSTTATPPTVSFDAATFDGSTSGFDAASILADGATSVDGEASDDAGSDAQAADAADAAPVGNAFYVDPATGNDANNGSQAMPFKTIVKGISVAQPNDTVWLANTTFTSTTETQIGTVSAAGCGGTNGITVPTGVTVRAMTSGQTTISVNGSYGFCLAGGTLLGLKIERPVDGARLVVAVSGSSTIRGTSFKNCGTGGGGGEACVMAQGAASLLIEPDALTNYYHGAAHTFLASDDTSQVTVNGGSVVGPLDTGYSGNATIVARGASTLRMKNVTVDPDTQSVIAVTAGTATLDLDQVTFTGASGPCVWPRGGKVKAVGSTFTKCQYGFYSRNFDAETAEIELTDSHVDLNTSGMSFGYANAIKVTLVNTTLSQNAQSGIESGAATQLQMTGGSATNNGTRGINLNNAGAVNSITLRSVTVTGNGTTGVGITGTGGSTANLGTLASPGKNTFSGNTGTGVSLSAAITVPAVGNTWNANVQLADAMGAYAVPMGMTTYDVTGGTGTNYTLTGGGVLQLAAK